MHIAKSQPMIHEPKYIPQFDPAAASIFNWLF